MKFKSDIEVQAGLKDSSGSIGASGQILSSTNGNVSWVTPTVNTIARDVQNEVKAGVAINKGQAVYVTGADGTNIIVGLASNTSEATSSKTLGLLNATVAINGKADVVQIGRLSGLNTIGAVVGDPVWLGTNGNLIYGLTNKPYAPAHLVFIGVVTRVNANNGEIFITVQNGFELKEIHDVDIITNVPINGDVLGYDGTLWVNKTIAEWLGYTPANASGTTNYVSKFTGANSLGDSQIFDNGTNVGIGTNLPQATLQVGNGTGVKSIYVTGSGTNLGLGGLSVSFLGFATGTISTVNTSGAVPLGVGTRSTQPLVLGTNNAERMRIDSSGNVGIGTTSPLFTSFSQLTIKGTDGGLTLQSNSTGISRIFFAKDETSSSEGLIRYEHSNNSMNFWTQASERMRIASNGAIKFNSYGSGSFTGTATQRLAVDSSGNVIEIPIGGGAVDGSGTTNYVTKWLDADTIGNSQIFDNGSGVGIGTTSPNYTTAGRGVLDINGSSQSMLALSVGGVGKSFLFYTGTDLLVSNESNGAIKFNTNGSEKAIITSSGNVGIGTTTPQAKLDVNGTLNVGSLSSGSNAVISLANNASGGTRNIYYKSSDVTINITSTGGNDLMTITNGGNVGIGTTIPSYKTVIHSSSVDTDVLCVSNDQINADSLQHFVGISLQDQYSNGSGNVSAIRSYSNLYSQWGSTLTFSTTGTGGNGVLERMRITSGGNVGIGTASPTAKLTIVGVSTDNAGLASFQNTYNATSDGSYYPAAQFINSYGNHSYGIIAGFKIGNAGGNDRPSILFYNDNAAKSWQLGQITSGWGSNDDFGIGYRSSNDPNSFSNWPTNYFTITSGGSVGIGTTSPGAKLELYMASGGSNALRLNTNFVNGNYIDLNPYISGVSNGGFELSQNGTRRLVISESGNVGIGTTTPSEKLTISGGALRLESATGVSSYVHYISPGNDEWSAGMNGAYDFQIAYSNGLGTPRMTLLKGGNVGIGTSSPSTKLEVVGNIKSSLSGYEFQIYPAFNTNIVGMGASSNHNLAIVTNATERMRITSAGNVGINTTAPIHKLSVNGKIGGDVYADSFVEFTATTETIVSADGNVVLGYAQNVVVDNEGSLGVGTIAPEVCAAVEIKSTTQGFLPPRMDTRDRDNIDTPVFGLMIFNTDDEVVQVFTNGGGWRTLAWL